MSEFGGLWKHENNQHTLVHPKTECGCPSGGGIKNGHIRYGGMQKEKKKMINIIVCAGGDFPTPKLQALHRILSSDFLNAVREVYENIYETVDVGGSAEVRANATAKVSASTVCLVMVFFMLSPK